MSLVSDSDSVAELQKEVRGLKRKLALAESNLARLHHVAVTQDRVETVINNTLKKERRFFQLVLENTNNILLLFDFDGRFAYASDSFLRDMGIANFGLISGRHYEEVLRSLIDEEILIKLTGALNTAINQKTTVSLEEQFAAGKRKEARIFSIDIVPMFEDNGESAGIMAILNDITEIKKLTKQQVEAEAANNAKSTFLAKMSHEIRTPLNAILGIAEMQMQNRFILNDANDTNETAGNIDTDIEIDTEEAFDKIYNSARVLLNIINDLLDFSKIETGMFDLSVDKYSVAAMVSASAHLNMVRINSKPIEFKVDADENTPSELFGDEGRIKQILNNLLSNAFKYTQEGEVELKVYAESSGSAGQSGDITLVMTVKDTGQGMTSEQIDKLYDEYTRFNLNANRTIEGVGLGMSITRHLVNMMNGEIIVESEPGAGTVFTVRLPQKNAGGGIIGKELSDDLRKFRANRGLYAKEARIAYKKMPKARVLAVDDVDTNLYVAKGLLAPYGLSADTAVSGYEAIEKLKNGNTYDIIFMDHMMPYMSGIETAVQIRQMGYDLPIVALTANAVSGIKEMFIENGFDDFLSKPVDILELNNILEKWIPEEKQKPAVIMSNNQEHDAGVKNPFRIEGLDTAKGILMTGGDIEDYLRTLAVYHNDGQEKISQIKACLSENNLALYTIYVHALKSASGIIGAKELSDAAMNLEAAGRRGDRDYINANSDDFLAALEKILSSISPVISGRGTGKYMDDADIILMKEELADLKAAMENFDAEAINRAADNLREYEIYTETGDIIGKIMKYKLMGDYDEATALIDGLLL
jgi:PAS domain S-box-containing protein